jgi:predicted dehydrogenase
MLRGAIIGLGNIAVRGHIPAYAHDEQLRQTVRIAACADIVEHSVERANEFLPGAAFYTDVAAMLEREKPDFVDICTPPHTHAGYVTLCSSRGIHVVCEKPLAASSADAAIVERSVRSSNIVFVPCHQYKYSPLWSTIKEQVASGCLGSVTLAQFNVFRTSADSGTAGWNPLWRIEKSQSGGGILADTGAHYLYLIQHFFGLPIRLGATLRTLKHAEYAVEDTALLTLEYSDKIVQVATTWAAGHRANSAFVVGTHGSLSYDGTRLTKTSAGGTEELPMPDVADKQQYVQWYAALFREFIGRITADNRSTDLLDEAINVMKLLDRSYRASMERTMLDVS